MVDPVDREVQLPAWLWTYYTQDTLVQRVVKECQAAGHDKQQMYRTLLEQLLIDREKQRADTLKALQDYPPVPVLPEMPVATDWTQDLGGGYVLVPVDQVTATGLFMAHLPVSLPITRWAVTGPDNRALQSENGGVHHYLTPGEAIRDVEILREHA